MEPSLDIFRTEPNGAVYWLAAVQDLAAAKARRKSAAASSPGTYVVLNQRTRSRIRIEVAPDGNLTTRPA